EVARASVNGFGGGLRGLELIDVRNPRRPVGYSIGRDLEDGRDVAGFGGRVAEESSVLNFVPEGIQGVWGDRTRSGGVGRDADARPRPHLPVCLDEVPVPAPGKATAGSDDNSEVSRDAV